MKPFILSMPNQKAESNFTPVTLDNASYSFFCNPISIRMFGYNYFSYINSTGGQEIVRVDDNGNKLTKLIWTGMTKDEHNTASMIPIDDTILVTWTGHNINALYRAIYDKDLNVVVAATMLQNSGALSYTSIAYASGKVFLFTRAYSIRWVFMISEDKGLTWSDPLSFYERGTATDKPYLVMQKYGTELVLFLSMHPLTTNSRQLSKLVIDTVTGDVYENDGTVINNVYSGYVTKTLQELQTAFTSPVGETFWVMDVTADDTYYYAMVVMIVQDEIEDSYPSGNYKLLRFDRSGNRDDFDIIPHGRAYIFRYFGWAYFVQTMEGVWDRTIYLSHNVADTWSVEKWKWTGTEMVKVSTIKTQYSITKALSRPKPPYNSGDGGAKLCIQNNYYPDYYDWTGQLEIS